MLPNLVDSWNPIGKILISLLEILKFIEFKKIHHILHP